MNKEASKEPALAMLKEVDKLLAMTLRAFAKLYHAFPNPSLPRLETINERLMDILALISKNFDIDVRQLTAEEKEELMVKYGDVWGVLSAPKGE